MVTAAAADLAEAAAAAGLEVDPLDADRCLVYFKPNQIYFMLAAVRLETLYAAGDLEANDWIVATTWPTSRSIGELADAFNRIHSTDLRTFRVRDYQAGRKAARSLLEKAGIGAVAVTAAMGWIAQGAAPDGRAMRGAMLIDAESGARVPEVDRPSAADRRPFHPSAAREACARRTRRG